MTWDDTDAGDGELTATEWNNHVTDQKNHNTRHESGGGDEINVAGLAGVLADPQVPQAHDHSGETLAHVAINSTLTGGTELTSLVGTNLTINASGELEAAAGSETQLSQEEVEDYVNDLLAGGTNVSLTYDDTNGVLTIAGDAVEVLVDDDTAGEKLSVVRGVTDFYWGNVDPDTLSGETLASHDVWLDTSDGDAGSGLSELASGTVTLTSGATPAHDATLGLSLAETEKVSVVCVYPDTSGQVAANYAFSDSWWQVWDDTAGVKDVHLQVDWQTDPGSDLTVAYEVLQ